MSPPEERSPIQTAMHFPPKIRQLAQQFTNVLPSLHLRSCFSNQARKKIRGACRRCGIKGKIIDGGFRIVVVSDTYVLKTRYGRWHGEIGAEISYFQSMRKTCWKHHFPKSMLFYADGVEVALQERIDPNRRYFDATSDELLILSEFFGLDAPVWNNVGWRRIQGQLYPVFFDPELHEVAIPSSKPERRGLALWLAGERRA